MKVRARQIEAGGRIIIKMKGKRTSWHVSEVHMDRTRVRVRCDRVVKGLREHHEIELGPKHVVEFVEREDA